MKRIVLLTGTLVVQTALGFLLAGCEEKKPAPVAPVKPAAQAVAPAAQIAAPVNVEPPKFVYQVEGRRDPFLPLLALKGKDSGIDIGNPLEAYDLMQFQLKGILIGLSEPKAIVVGPDGKTYILKKGMRFGKSDGVIRDITREKIVVEERYQDLNGETHRNIQEIKVPKREGV